MCKISAKIKKIYLDTNIYNKLLDFMVKREIKIEQLSSIIASNNYIVLFSPTIFEELLHTVNSSIGKTADLIRLSYGICSKDYIIKPPESLICDELKCFLRGEKEDSPFIGEKEKRIFIELWEKSTNPDFFHNVPQGVLKQYQNRKKDFLSFNKQSKNKFSPQWKPYQEIGFQEFHQTSLVNKEGQMFIKDICIKCLGNNGDKLDVQTLDFTVLRHLRFVIKANLGLIYNTLIKDKKPKWGDNIDIHHIILSSTADIFVTDDSDLQEFLGILDEEIPTCVNFEWLEKVLSV